MDTISGFICKFDKESKTISVKGCMNERSPSTICLYTAEQELELLIAFMEGVSIVIDGKWNPRIKSMYISSYKLG